MLVNSSIRKVTYEHSIRFEDFESVTSCFNRLSQSQWTDAKDVSERLGITQQTYARLEANPASAGFERLFRCSASLSGDRTFIQEPLSDAKPEYGAMHNYSSLPARREKW